MSAMARQETKMATRYHHHHQHTIPPKRRLEYLLNETYSKIDELKELLRNELTLTGGAKSTDPAVDRMFARQDYLITLCAEACSEPERKPQAQPGPSGFQSGAGMRPSCSYVAQPLATTEQSQNSRAEKEYTKTDGSWYGSLDRSLAKKKKHQIIDKRRRHTKTIGSMAGLDVIKKSAELKPDEQYEIGLPAAPRVTSTRSSIFPMTQHQYYTALMESKLTKKPAYPLEVRQPSLQYYNASVSALPQRQQVNPWAYQVEGLDENKNMKKQEILQSPQHPHTTAKPPNLVPLPCRSLGSELAYRHSSKSSKKWYETNLDEAPSSPITPVTTQNPSPSPSMLSSTRGSSRGSVASGMDTVDAGIARMAISSPANESTEFTSKSSESSESWSGTGHEVTKPFEMSDYYKYSTKFRSRNSPVSEETNHTDSRISNGPSSASTSVIHSRQPSQVRQASIDATNDYRDTNGNPAVGPKLPPKQRRNQNKSISSSTLIFDGEMSNGDSSKDVWITNEPTFV